MTSQYILLQMTVDSIKQKLSFHTGTPPSAMLLELKDDNGQLMAALTEDSRQFGFYSPFNG
jgi:hypothetical protein